MNFTTIAIMLRNNHSHISVQNIIYQTAENENTVCARKFSQLQVHSLDFTGKNGLLLFVGLFFVSLVFKRTF